MSAWTTPHVCFGTAAGAGLALDTAYTTSLFGNGWHDAREFNQALLFFTLSGLAPTSVDWLVEFSFDDGTTWHTENTQATSGGTITHAYEQRSLPLNAAAPTGSAGAAIHVPLGASGTRWRIRARRTGGDGTTALLVRASYGSDR